MRLSKKSLYFVMLLALIIMAGCGGKNDNVVDEAKIGDGLQVADLDTEMDSDNVETLGEQDFSYASLPVPMIPHEGGAVLGNFMKLIEK